MLCPMKAPKQVRKIKCSLSRGFVDSTGKFTVTDDSTRPYVLRRGRGLSTVAPLLRFSRVKPRYRRRSGLLVMSDKVRQ
jgi:hypothetical protein